MAELIKKQPVSALAEETELRNSTEIEADRLFLLSLLRKSGRDLNIQEATDVLNARRAAAAREYAMVLGKSEGEVEEAVANSALPRLVVAADIAAVRNSLQHAIEAGAASWLDNQLRELQRDREQTYAIDEMALAELERSRKMVSRKTRGIPIFGDEDPEELEQEIQELIDAADGAPLASKGKIPQLRSRAKKMSLGVKAQGMQAVEITEREDEMGGQPRFLEILSMNIMRRIELRQEERMLMFGREWARKVSKADQKSAVTFAKLLTGKKNAVDAEQAVLEAYQEELQQLVLAEEMELGPSTPAMLHMEKLRVQRQEQKLRELREYMKLNNGDGDGTKIIEVVFEKVEPGKFREVKKIGEGSEASNR